MPGVMVEVSTMGGSPPGDVSVSGIVLLLPHMRGLPACSKFSKLCLPCALMFVVGVQRRFHGLFSGVSGPQKDSN